MKKTICVDLDGVLAEYDGWKGINHIGNPIDGAREFVAGLKTFANVMIWTTRTNPLANENTGMNARELRSLVKKWLVKHDIPFDAISTDDGKPLCAAFVDDRAVHLNPLVFKPATVRRASFQIALEDCKKLCGVMPDAVYEHTYAEAHLPGTPTSSLADDELPQAPLLDLQQICAELEEAARLSDDDLGEWWSTLVALHPRVMDAGSEGFRAAYENEVRAEHDRLKAEFRIVEEMRTVEETRMYRELRHKSEWWHDRVSSEGPT